PTPWCYALTAEPKNRGALTCCRPCTLHQSRTQIRVAVGGLWSFLNACTFPITWTQARPTRHLFNGRKGVQVWPCLCQDRGCRKLAYSGTALQQCVGFLERCAWGARADCVVWVSTCWF